MIAAGYEDGNDADRLRTDPMFKLAMARLEDEASLCSQPTISRLENLPDTRTLLRMGRAMVDLYCASFRQVPRRIVLDVDDTFDAVHGGQQLGVTSRFAQNCTIIPRLSDQNLSKLKPTGTTAAIRRSTGFGQRALV